MLFSQFSILAENVQKALGTQNNAGIESITQQIANIRQSQEKWPAKILQTYKEQKIPAFAAEDVTKLNQAHCSRIEHVNNA